MHRKKQLKLNKGFTLIEVMIVVTLFSVIMIIGTGAVLNSNNVYRKTEQIRTIIDNLHFVMEDMSKSIRTGEDYHCDVSVTPISDSRSCVTGLGSLAFEAVGGDTIIDDQVIYGFFPISPAEIIDGSPICDIRKKDQNNTSWNGNPSTLPVLTPPEVKIRCDASGFLVVGAEEGDALQPRVLIKLSGIIVNPKDSSQVPFNIQTSVSQRNIDL